MADKMMHIIKKVYPLWNLWSKNLPKNANKTSGNAVATPTVPINDKEKKSSFFIKIPVYRLKIPDFPL